MKRLKGIYKNCHPLDQPEGTYRDALNISIDEYLGAVVNEKGTTLIDNLPVNYIVLGNIVLPNDDIVIFSTGANDEIGLFNGSVYTTLVNDDLNFNQNNSIHGSSYQNKFNDQYVFWVDGLNPARFLNVDDPTFSSTTYLNIFPSTEKHPNINIDSINNIGGSLKSGAYYFAIAYKHKDGTLTNFYTIEGPAFITTGIDNKTGGEGGQRTSKSISLSFDNIDLEYEAIQIAVIPSYEEVIDEVLLLPEISVETTEYTYSGTESVIPGSLEELQIDKAFYEKPKTLAIHEDSLLIGNVNDPEFLDLQPYVNNIKV
ncbi:MAG: hypothetical protein WD512_18550, partial [Candidatus Paceibacterota bacterium]